MSTELDAAALLLQEAHAADNPTSALERACASLDALITAVRNLESANNAPSYSYYDASEAERNR